jgi:hypothetical protein
MWEYDNVPDSTWPNLDAADEFIPTFMNRMKIVLYSKVYVR